MADKEYKTIKPKKEFNITKFKFSCDDIDTDLRDANLPATYNHMWVITAKPRQGKSTYIMNLISKSNKASPYNKKFDRVFLFSPSLKTIDEDPFDTISDDQKYKELTYENLTEVYKKIEDSGERVLLICDDVVNDLKDKDTERLLTKMMMNRRHICGRNEEGDSAGLSCWITTQIFNRLPRPLRASASHYTIFKTTNKKELETIYDELILLDKNEFKDLLGFVFADKYNSLYVNTDNDWDKMYHKNFDRIDFTTN